MGMSKEGYFGFALCLVGFAMAVSQMVYPQIPVAIGWSIIAFLLLVSILLVRKGILIRKSSEMPTIVLDALIKQVKEIGYSFSLDIMEGIDHPKGIYHVSKQGLFEA